MSTVISRRSAKYLINVSETVATNTKTIVVDKPVELNMLHAVYTPSATVGNRQLKFSVLKADDSLFMDDHVGAVFPATTVVHLLVMKGIYRETAFVDNEIQVPWPTDLVLMPGWKLKVADDANIDASGDSFLLDYQFERLVED